MSSAASASSIRGWVAIAESITGGSRHRARPRDTGTRPRGCSGTAGLATAAWREVRGRSVETKKAAMMSRAGPSGDVAGHAGRRSGSRIARRTGRCRHRPGGVWASRGPGSVRGHADRAVLQVVSLGLYLGSALRDWRDAEESGRGGLPERVRRGHRFLVPMPREIRETEAATLIGRLTDQFTARRIRGASWPSRWKRRLTDYIAGITGQRVRTSVGGARASLSSGSRCRLRWGPATC